MFLVGSYGPDWPGVVARTVRDPTAWTVVPQHALVSTAAGRSLGTVSPSAGPAPVTTLLRSNGLIGSDDVAWQILTHGPVTRYAYIRTLGGIPVHTNKAVAGIVAASGEVWGIGRRRPLLAASVYPLRSAVDAWRLAQQGRWMTMFLDDDTSPDPARIDEFVVTAVQLAYAETEVNASRELMQPYYVFRDGAAHALYVPAIADPWAQLPDPR